MFYGVVSEKFWFKGSTKSAENKQSDFNSFFFIFGKLYKKVFENFFANLFDNKMTSDVLSRKDIRRGSRTNKPLKKLFLMAF